MAGKTAEVGMTRGWRLSCPRRRPPVRRRRRPPKEKSEEDTSAQSNLQENKNCEWKFLKRNQFIDFIKTADEF